jgi:hypothetical protein
MEEVRIITKMEVDMKEIGLTIRKRDMVFSFGLLVIGTS